MEPIRVLQVVVSMDAGGIETLLMNYYRHIDRTKVQFDFLLHCKHKSYYEDEITALGGRIYRVPSYHPKDQLRYRAALKRFFAEHTEYKVVHSHITFYGMYVLRAAKRAGVPTRIAHSHSAKKFWRLDKTLPFRLVTRHGLKKQYTQIYACSAAAAEYMAPGKPFSIISNAIDARAFSFDGDARARIRRELGIGDEPVIGHVGRFATPKNHAFLIEIFAEYAKLSPRARLLLVGDGVLKDMIYDKAKALGINDRIIFTGVRSDIPALLSAMDVFVFPSLFEGFAISLAEAQASGLPCFKSDAFDNTSVFTDRVRVLSLKLPAKEWAKEIAAVDIGEARKDKAEEARKAGVDIFENAMRLQKIYLEAYGL